MSRVTDDVDALDQDTTEPDAPYPPSPLAMAEYQLAADAEATTLDARADTLFRSSTSATPAPVATRHPASASCPSGIWTRPTSTPAGRAKPVGRARGISTIGASASSVSV
jgi:hypothetical protein